MGESAAVAVGDGLGAVRVVEAHEAKAAVLAHLLLPECPCEGEGAGL